MTSSTPGVEDESTKLTPDSATEDAPVTAVPLVAGSVGADHCTQCDAALAPDQQYCVECGTRRGKPRFALQSSAPAAAPQVSAAAQQAGASPWSRAAVLAGIAALLLAIGVGVLIGHAITTNVRVVVRGATVAASTSGTGSGNSSSSSGGGSGNASSSSSNSSTGSSGRSGSSTVKPGAKCTNGTPGCQNGKETGNNFFSGG